MGHKHIFDKPVGVTRWGHRVMGCVCGKKDILLQEKKSQPKVEEDIETLM